jgi:predicted permease
MLTLIPLGRALGWSREVIACLLLTAGLANTSFVGFPLVEALYGKEGLAMAVWVDQGQFLVLASAGVLIAAYGSGQGRPSFADMTKKLLAFPPFIAFVAALLLHSVAFPAALKLTLEVLALLVVPLALLSVGWQLRLDTTALAQDGAKTAIGLGVRLLLAPAVVASLLFSLGQPGRATSVTIAEAAMAPMITGALLAIESGLSPRLAGLMVGLGVPISLLTVPAWAWAIARI